MLLYFLVLNVIFIPLINGANNVSVTLEQSSNNSGARSSSISTTKPVTKLTLLTEGGKVVTELPSLPKENTTVLLALDQELGNSKGKNPVKPRKGAPFLDSDEVEKSAKIIPPHLQSINGTEQNVTKLVPVEKLQTNRTTTKETKVNNNPTTTSVKIESSNIDRINKTTVKKPRILVYDDLASDKINEHPLPEFKSSSKPVSDQIPSPHNKLHLKSKGAEPGMLMPVVITMVVVPAFAVLAYMAVKRGREAWKNRHYKRMDFLLDGMYND